MKKLKSLYAIYLLFPIINLLTGLTTRFEITSITIGVIVRVIFMLAFAVYVFFFSKNKYSKWIKIYFGFLLLFAISYILVKNNFELTYLYNEANYLFKFMYYPVLFFSLISIFESQEFNVEKWKKIFFVSFIFYIVFILVPILLNSAFPAYVRDVHGFSGWFYAANELGPIVLMLYPTVYILLDKHKTLYVILSTIAIFTIVAIGTKVSKYGLAIVLVAFFVIYCIFTKKKYLNKGILLIGIITFGVLSFTPAKKVYTNLEDYNFKELRASKYIPSTSSSGSDKSDSEYQPFDLNTVLSNRNKRVVTANKNFTNNDLLNKLYGRGFYNIEKKKIVQIEMDFFDMLYGHGILGITLYLVPFGFIIWQLIKSIKDRKFAFSLELVYETLIVGLMLGIAFTSGHVLNAPAVTSFLAIYCIAICKYLNGTLKSKMKD